MLLRNKKHSETILQTIDQDILSFDVSKINNANDKNVFLKIKQTIQSIHDNLYKLHVSKYKGCDGVDPLMCRLKNLQKSLRTKASAIMTNNDTSHK